METIKQEPSFEDLYARVIFLQAQVTSLQEALFGYFELLKDERMKEKSALLFAQEMPRLLTKETNNSPYNVEVIGNRIKDLITKHKT